MLEIESIRRKLDEAYENDGVFEACDELAAIIAEKSAEEPSGKELLLALNSELTLAYLNAKRPQEALSTAIVARDLASEVLGEESAEYGNALFNLGSVYSVLESHEDCLACYREALNVYDNLFGYRDKYYYSALVGIGSEYQKMGQFDLAIYWFQLAADTCHACRQYLAMAKHDYDIGMLHLLAGNTEEAEKKIEEAAGICFESDYKDSDVYAACVEALDTLRSGRCFAK